MWLDYRLGVREVVLQEYLKQKYPSLAELFLIKDAKDFKRFENMLSPVNISKYPRFEKIIYCNQSTRNHRKSRTFKRFVVYQ